MMNDTRNPYQALSDPINRSDGPVQHLTDLARAKADAVGLSPETYAAKVELIADYLRDGAYWKARDEYKALVEAYRFVVIADGIYAEARKRASRA